jgi:hypothetical protein
MIGGGFTAVIDIGDGRLGTAISVAYNVTATWSDLLAAPAPPALESRAEPSEFAEAG